MKIFEKIAAKLIAMQNCVTSANLAWVERHAEALEEIMSEAPSGGGIDNGTELVECDSGEKKLVFSTAFHHSNGWTDHVVTITPSFSNCISIKISGEDRFNIKEYLTDVFLEWLLSEYGEEIVRDNT